MNIKPKVRKGFGRLIVAPRSGIQRDILHIIFHGHKLALTGLILLFFLGYYPTFQLTFPPIAQKQVLAQEEQKYEIVSATFPQPIILPHLGYLSTRYSTYHPGVDIATGLGMPIHAINPGVIDEVNFGFFGYGNHIIISHPNGFRSLYAHMGRVYVQKGQSIDTSNILGEVGMTGFTSGPHTHLEITHNGKYIDPLTILPELPQYPVAQYIKPTGASGETALQSQKSELRKTLRPDFH